MASNERQAYDDVPALVAFVKTKLLYGLRYVEDQQILGGDGTGQNVTGLITSAANFNTSLLSAAAGYTRIDDLRVALEQVETADEVPAGFFVLHATTGPSKTSIGVDFSHHRKAPGAQNARWRGGTTESKLLPESGKSVSRLRLF